MKSKGIVPFSVLQDIGAHLLDLKLALKDLESDNSVALHVEGDKTYIKFGNCAKFTSMDIDTIKMNDTCTRIKDQINDIELKTLKYVQNLSLCLS
jgi:hypothetical protein